jgi:hypothetical protein
MSLSTITVNIQEKLNAQVNLITAPLPKPYVDVRDYSSWVAAVDAIGSTEATLLIPNEQAVAVNKTVPSTLTQWFLRPGCLNVAVGVQVTMPRPEAGRYQIFKGLGTVKVEPPIDVYPEWWGA